MKSSTLIASYLWKDTWSRWLEQPSSFLARIFVGTLLVSVATVILLAFTLLERGIRERLEKFGLNTLVVREMVSSSDPELFSNVDRPDRLAPLADTGRKLRFRQLFLRARTEWQSDLVVLAYTPETFPDLAKLLRAGSPLICLSERLPENIQIQIDLGRQSGIAVVRRMNDLFRSLSADNLLLVPQGWAPDVEKIGYVETTVFEREQMQFAMTRYVEAVNLLYTLDRRAQPQMQSAVPMIRELEDLQSRQKQWRAWLAAVLGLTMALVYGAIAILEFRQNLFIGALLRSLGAPSICLYFRQWLENGLLANIAALLAIALVANFHHEIFGALGFSAKVLDLKQGNPYWSSEALAILLWVNVGAFLSSLPVAIGLRRPVGAVLN
jgi:hypothetical protein